MGASLALAGLSGCLSSSPAPTDEKIVPYVNQPEEIIPGKPLFFATAMPLGGFGRGVLVESHMGRPTKIEGNPLHPASLGAADVFMFGPYGWMYWLLILFNILIPQALWFRSLHTNVIVLFLIAISVNIGMWLERYVIIVVSLHRDFMPSAWGRYSGTIFDYGVFVGTIGLFIALLFLFIRVLPMISIFEMRELVHEEEAKND